MKIQVRSFRQGNAGAVRPPVPRMTNTERSILGPYLYVYSGSDTLERVKPVPSAASGAMVHHEKK